MGYESINVPQLDRAANWQVTASEKGYLQVRELLRRFASDMNQALALEDAVYRSNMEEELFMLPMNLLQTSLFRSE